MCRRPSAPQRSRPTRTTIRGRGGSRAAGLTFILRGIGAGRTKPDRPRIDRALRYIIYGAGAVGGSIGSRLFDLGHDVVLIARGPHLKSIQRDGLTVRRPDGETTSRI